MNEMIERVAKAMKNRAAKPLHNIPSLEPVLVGSLGDTWECLALAAIEAMREPSEGMLEVLRDNDLVGLGKRWKGREIWYAMIDAALAEK